MYHHHCLFLSLLYLLFLLSSLSSTSSSPLPSIFLLSLLPLSYSFSPSSPFSSPPPPPPPPPPLYSTLYSVSTDKTGAVWDVEVGVRVKKLRGHTSFVNSCSPARRGPQMLATGSDDGTIKVTILSLSLSLSLFVFLSVYLFVTLLSICLSCGIFGADIQYSHSITSTR